MTSNLFKIVFFFEFLSSTATLHVFNCAREEWMTLRTNLDSNFALSRTRLKVIATCAMHVYLFVIWMNGLFHVVHLSP